MLSGTGAAVGPAASSIHPLDQAIHTLPSNQLDPVAQEKDPSPKQEEVIRLSSRLVLVPVSVSDEAGKPVKHLSTDDFVIEEDGRRQELVALGEPGQTPLEISLLFDVSGSTNAQFAFQQQAAIGFMNEVLKPGDAVSVFAVGTTPKLVRARTTVCEDAVAGIMTIEPLKEATAFFDATADAAIYLGKTAAPGARRVLVVVSDGEENYSQRHGFEDTIRELQENDCLFYSINTGGSSITLNKISVRGQNHMQSMSSQTGGYAFLPERTEDLPAVFRQITEELQAQYLFGYYSDEAGGGSFRRITVRAPAKPQLRIRARQGYYASASN